ncbi:MAG: carbohydrate ABC transporter permease [Anaerolineae bacterium]
MRLSRDRLVSIALISPSIIAIAVFVYGFIAWTVRVSLSKWDGITPNFDWAGLANYTRLFANPRFQTDLRNTAVFTVLFLGACLVIGLLLAVLLDQRLRGENFFRSIYLFPMAISFIVTGVVWRWLLNPATGNRTTGVNLLFDYAGLDFLQSGWYVDPKIGIMAIVIPAVWQMSGFTMALYLGGLRSIPDDIREAARVDGASEWQLYRHVILPLLQPVTLSAVIILGHISLKIFDLIVAMTPDGGPAFSSDVPALFMFKTTFAGNHFSQGASIAIILLLMVAVLVVPYLVYSVRAEAEL